MLQQEVSLAIEDSATINANNLTMLPQMTFSGDGWLFADQR